MNTHLFGRFYPAIVSAFVLATVTAADAAAANSVLLAFSSDHCGHCQAMVPTLRQLEQSGTPIRHVNVNAEPELARRHGIRQVPTYVILSAGRELTRLVGTQSAQSLRQALAIDPAGTLFQTKANLHGQTVPDAAQARRAAAPSAPTGDPRGEAMPSLTMADAVQRARAATVRLKVHDGNGFGVGTGTIIDRHGDEALVLTCGHLFRETKLQSKVEVQLFVAGQVKTVPGQVIDYDADNRDIALVVMRPGFDVQPIQIANPDNPPQTGQTAFSFGCDHGDDPSRRDTAITGINKYNQHVGASNIEIAGAPVDGRSGGGLFDAMGQLIGVCNAADYKGDVGIYTGPGSVKWQLDRVQLAHLYQTQPPARVTVPSRRPNSHPGQPQTRLAALNAPQQPSPNRSRPNEPAATEMIIILRDPNAPGGQRVMNIQQPTPELMEVISRHAR
ncbi:trypsin-like peptidase domain-containing protein [Stieleria sp. ICT_E10.1]|uniref:trypsin-like peptidase domain-containing protein n=1 Tax=Stieleria sedimenti TaxID=2976331 RepID=UPI00217F8BE0|nr:trypsin-like peptidase domain-containing protein [Stieleria sedimenti]MCS7465539.1 trypsin-like peptidase domain-containing protein [Stieleria sedimenti]